MSDKKRRPAKPGGVKAHAKLETEQKRPGSREPVREKKIDRNAPCPCGSGKKYKKCCAGGEGLWTRIKRFFGLRGKKGAGREPDSGAVDSESEGKGKGEGSGGRSRENG